MSVRNFIRVSVRLALAWGFFTFVNILINENPRFNGADLLALILMVGVGRLLYKQLKESGK